MKFAEISSALVGVPYIKPERAQQLYEFIVAERPQHCLELGFAHGASACYTAAALQELGQGHLTVVDIVDSADREPNIEQLLERTGLAHCVSIHREQNSYTWFLKKEIERRTLDGVCEPVFDFCYIDGPKNWTVDGLAFFLVDKLLRRNGTLLFDDYSWRYCDYRRKDITDGISHRAMSPDQLEQANIEKVFELLVMQHPCYGGFSVQHRKWAWAKKLYDLQDLLYPGTPQA